MSGDAGGQRLTGGAALLPALSASNDNVRVIRPKGAAGDGWAESRSAGASALSLRI
jgi:hypothetical protein